MVALCGMPTIQYSARSRSTRFFKLNDLHISTSLFFVMTDMSRDSIVDRHCLRLRMCRMLSTRVRRRRKFGEVSWTECTGQGNDFEWIPTVKMETAQPMEGSFGNEYQSIYNHCGVMTPEVAERWKNVDFCLFLEKDPLLENFQNYAIVFRKDLSRHRSTCCVQILWNLTDGNR